MEPLVKINHPLEHFIILDWQKKLPSLSVGFSARNDDKDRGIYRGMNMALHVGDHQDEVIKNRLELAKMLNFSFAAWTSAEQVHGNNVEIVGLNQRGNGRMTREDALQDTDGILTNQPDILLTSFYADCVPLFFLDPLKKVIGLAHAGWKGTALKIAEKMVQAMSETYNSNISDILVVIGPAIGQCCYEVNEQVARQFMETELYFGDGAIIDKKNGHYDLDLKKINKEILKKAGILPNNIEVSGWCTSCNNELFFSHRKEQGKTGRMASWIGLRKDE